MPENIFRRAFKRVRRWVRKHGWIATIGSAATLVVTWAGYQGWGVAVAVLTAWFVSSGASTWATTVLAALAAWSLVALGQVLHARKRYYQALSGNLEKTAAAIPVAADPDDDTWRERPRLELYVIACRSVGVAPQFVVPEGPALDRMRFLGDEIRDGELRVASGDIDGVGGGNGHMVQILHAELRQFAERVNNASLLAFCEKWRPTPIAPPPPNTVPLKEAAVRSYEATKQRLAGKFAWAGSDDPDEIITWYCYALWDRVEIYGNQPPSREPELIPRAVKNTHTFYIQEGVLLLKGRFHYGSKDWYENLCVMEADLPKAIEEIKALG